MRRLPAIAGLAVLGAACQDYRFEQKCPEGITESQVTVPAAEPTPADILFVVDNSGSMADEQENLAANFEFFINQIAGNGDYRIAIVTTDQSSGKEMQGLADPVYVRSSEYVPLDEIVTGNCGDPPQISPGCCFETDIDTGCFRGPDPGTRIIDSRTMSREEQIAIFQQNVRVGSCGSGNERGLAAMRDALEKTRPGGCNQDFLRPEANLVVVFVSDEEDTDNTPIEQYVEDLIDLKGSAAKVRVAAIVGAVDGTASVCNPTELASCGSLCDGPPPPVGSERSCNNSRECPDAERCVANRCITTAWYRWETGSCNWCSFFDVADCCSALAGGRYLQFARAVEARVSQADPVIDINRCLPVENAAKACLIDSICQDEFGATLEAIARDLVIVDTYTLDPAPENPDGVSVRVVGGRFGSEGEALDLGTDFTITVDPASDTAQLRTLGMKTPGEGEELEIAYVSEISKPTEQRGACGPNTSTSALSLD